MYLVLIVSFIHLVSSEDFLLIDLGKLIPIGDSTTSTSESL